MNSPSYRRRDRDTVLVGPAAEGLYELAFIQKARRSLSESLATGSTASMNSPSYRRRDNPLGVEVVDERASMNSPSYRRRDGANPQRQTRD